MPGSIQFVSVPSGAEIFLDGIYQYTLTPCTVVSVPVGSHSYALVLAGYLDSTGSVLVEENKTAEVSAILPPLPVPEEKKGIGAGTVLGIALLGAGILGAVIISRRK